jgi:hypothetical protein
VTTSEGFAVELKSIDIRKKTTEMISEDILSKKAQEKKEMTEIQDKEKKLLEQSKRAQADEPEDPFEVYITSQVKRAQLAWTYHETQAKMDQMKRSFDDAVSTIVELDAANPEFIGMYKEKYMQARKESNIPEDHDSFLKYLGMDVAVSIENAALAIEKKTE